jgi:large subunit ribosomal protein L5
MIEKFGYKNRLEVPRLDKIVINMGVGEATQDKKKVETAAAEMQLIAGQKPVVTKAKKSIAQFKLREGMPIGVKVTLRRERMYEFLDRLITVAPAARARFPGASTPSRSTAAAIMRWGLKEQIIFPEISYDRIDKVRGMDIIVTTTRRRTRKRASCCAFSTSVPAGRRAEAGGLSPRASRIEKRA